MRNAVLLALPVCLGLGTGCGSVCDQAANVTESCDWYGVGDVENDGDAGEREQDCTGAAEVAAQCIVDHADAYCEYLGALLEDPTADPGDNEYYRDCIAQ